MKKIFLLVLGIIFSCGSVFGILNHDIPLNEGTTYLTKGFGRDFRLTPTTGMGPYTFYSGNCAEFKQGDGLSADYRTATTASTCSLWIYDAWWANYEEIEVNVTCVCNQCDTSTDGAMTGSGVTFEEVAFDPQDGPDTPDDGAAC